MPKCAILKEEKEILEINNGIVNLKFYKIGESQGFYDISFNNGTAILNHCYACINSFSPDSKSLIETASLEYCFEHDIKEIRDEIGSGFQIVFSALCSSNQKISFKLQFKLYDDKEFILIKLLDLMDGYENPLSLHSISPLTVKNQKLWLNGTKIETNLHNISWFKNGWQSWSPNYTLFGKEKDKRIVPVKMMQRVLDNQDYEIKGRFYSEYCTVITDLESKNSLILGFTTLKDQFSRIVLDYKNTQILKLLTAFGCGWYHSAEFLN